MLLRTVSGLAPPYADCAENQVKSEALRLTRVRPMTTSNKPTFQEIKAAPCSSPTTWKSVRAPFTPRPSCAPSARSPGAPPTCSPPAAPRTAATARIPNRLQHYYQYQVVLKPSPPNILDLYLGSLRALGIDHRPARRAVRRGRLGEPHARRLGPRLGSLAERHGGHAVHLLPAGRRHRLPADHRRDHLRHRAPRDVPAGRRERL
jgi:hypothetical protein